LFKESRSRSSKPNSRQETLLKRQKKERIQVKMGRVRNREKEGLGALVKKTLRKVKVMTVALTQVTMQRWT